MTTRPQTSRRMPPAPRPARRAVFRRLVAALITLGIVIPGGFLLYHYRLIPFLGPSGPRKGHLTGIYSIDRTKVLPFRVLKDERETFGERRVLRRVIAMAYNARREQVRHTMYQAIREAEMGSKSAEVIIIWAVPHERLLKGDVLYRRCNLLLGELVSVSDSTEFHGRPLPGAMYFSVLVPGQGTPPPLPELERHIELCRALQAADVRDPYRMDVITEQVAHRHGLTYQQMVASTGRIRNYYPSLPQEEIPLRP